MNIPITLANYKELKILRQYQTVPAPFSSYLLGFAFVQVLMFVVSCAVVVGAAAIVFGITLPPNFVGVAWMTLLSLTAVYSLGFALGSLFSSVRTAQPVATAIFFILFFLSGAAIPRSQFPEWLQNVTAFVPLAQIVDAYAWAWLGRPNALSLPFYLSVLTIFTVSMLILIRSLKRR